MNAIPQPPGWQTGFLSVLPAVQTHAQIHFRRLPADNRQEATQEAIAAAGVAYRLLAAKGRLYEAHPSTIADFAVKHVRNGRHVGGRQDAARDVMSPIAQARYGFRTTGFDLYDHDTGEWRQLTIADRRASVPDLAAFRIDFAQWLKTLTRRDRRIVGALAGGDTTNAVAGRFGISSGRVSQLRRKYEHLWLTFQGERPAEAA
jgi:hypothetical protein